MGVLQKWNVYGVYPKGRGNLSTIEELGLAIQRSLQELKHLNLAYPYRYFLMLYSPDRIKLGIKTERDVDKDIDELTDGLKRKHPEYSNLVSEPATEDPETCELMAIATETRQCLLKPLPNWANPNRIAKLLHFILNPYGYDPEAFAHLLALLNIGGGVSDPDALLAIDMIAKTLTSRNRIRLDSNKWVLV